MLCLSVVLLAACAMIPDITAKWILLLLVVIFEILQGPIVRTCFLPSSDGSQWIAINVEHENDRYAGLVMVVLGESVLTAVQSMPKDKAAQAGYLHAMFLTLAVSFNLALNYYYVQMPHH